MLAMAMIGFLLALGTIRFSVEKVLILSMVAPERICALGMRQTQTSETVRS
jgi:hypothetical protein